METGGLKIYAFLARLGVPRSYLGKIFLVVFMGVHVPLIALVLYLLLGGNLIAQRPGAAALAVLLIAPVVGTVATLWALHGLLAPVRLASSSLRGYLDSKEVPRLSIHFSDEAGRLLADVQYIAADLDETIRSLEALSGTDHLTGLPNRREGERRLAMDVARAGRDGGVLTVAVLDLNSFKLINDNWGHQAGDDCLRRVADVIRRNIREGDWLARWGGDEFVLVLWDTSVFSSPESLLQRISRDLKASPVCLPQGPELVLSISAGARTCSGGETPQELLSEADKAMYDAKRQGRPWVLSA